MSSKTVRTTIRQVHDISKGIIQEYTTITTTETTISPSGEELVQSKEETYETEAPLAANDKPYETEAPLAADDKPDDTEAPLAADDKPYDTEAPLATDDTEAPLATDDTEAPLAANDTEAPLAANDTEVPLAADDKPYETEAQERVQECTTPCPSIIIPASSSVPAGVALSHATYDAVIPLEQQHDKEETEPIAGGDTVVKLERGHRAEIQTTGKFSQQLMAELQDRDSHASVKMNKEFMHNMTDTTKQIIAKLNTQFNAYAHESIAPCAIRKEYLIIKRMIAQSIHALDQFIFKKAYCINSEETYCTMYSWGIYTIKPYCIYPCIKCDKEPEPCADLYAQSKLIDSAGYKGYDVIVVDTSRLSAQIKALELWATQSLPLYMINDDGHQHKYYAHDASQYNIEHIFAAVEPRTFNEMLKYHNYAKLFKAQPSVLHDVAQPILRKFAYDNPHGVIYAKKPQVTDMVQL